MADPLFDVNSTYTFDTLAPALLGIKFTRVKCKIAGMDVYTARKFAEIDQQYRKIFPALPAGSVDDINHQTFYLFQAENGTNVVLAEQWINKDTIQKISSLSANVYISDATPEKMNQVRLALHAINVHDFTINIIGS